MESPPDRIVVEAAERFRMAMKQRRLKGRDCAREIGYDEGNLSAFFKGRKSLGLEHFLRAMAYLAERNVDVLSVVLDKEHAERVERVVTLSAVRSVLDGRADSILQNALEARSTEGRRRRERLKSSVKTRSQAT